MDNLAAQRLSPYLEKFFYKYTAAEIRIENIWKII